MKCAGCRYRRRWETNSRITACHYLYDTGNHRECSAAECYALKIRYKPKQPNKLVTKEE